MGPDFFFNSMHISDAGFVKPALSRCYLYLSRIQVGLKQINDLQKAQLVCVTSQFHDFISKVLSPIIVAYFLVETLRTSLWVCEGQGLLGYKNRNSNMKQ